MLTCVPATAHARGGERNRRRPLELWCRELYPCRELIKKLRVYAEKNVLTIINIHRANFGSLLESKVYKKIKVMKARLLVMVGMMISTAIFAQKTTRESRKPETSGYERMKKELALTDKQYASLKDIDSKYIKKRNDEHTKNQVRRLEERETMRSIRTEREREMRKVFTAEQNKKWDDYRAAHRAKTQRFSKESGKRKHGFHHRKHDRARGRNFDRKG